MQISTHIGFSKEANPDVNGTFARSIALINGGGTIAAWAKDSGPVATTVYDDGIANGAEYAVYKGLATGSVNGASFLYATDFASAGSLNAPWGIAHAPAGFGSLAGDVLKAHHWLPLVGP